MSWVLTRFGPHLSHGKLWLTGTEVTVGRSGANSYLIPSTYVSRRHAIFKYNIDDNKWEVQDVKSSNGLFINGFRTNAHETYPLIEGDTVGFGAPPQFAQDSDDVFVYTIGIEIKQEADENPAMPEPVLIASNTVAQDDHGVERTASGTTPAVSNLKGPSPTAAAIKAESSIEQLTAQTRLELSSVSLKSSAGRPGTSVTVKQEAGTTKSSFSEKFPGQNLVPVPGPIPTSRAVQGENAGNSHSSAESVFNMKCLEGSLIALNANPKSVESNDSGSNNQGTSENASVKIKIDRSALVQRIIILDSDDDDEDNLENDNAAKAGELDVGDADDQRVKGSNGVEVDNESSDGDVELVDFGYSQEHEVFEISDDEQYFASSQRSEVIKDPESSRDVSAGDEAPLDDSSMCPDLPEDYVYDDMEAEASRSPDMALDKPGPSGLQKESSPPNNVEEAAEVDQADDSKDEDEESNDEPDEQSIRDRLRYFLKPVYTTAVDIVARPDRRTQPIEPLPLGTSVRRDRGHIDKGILDNGECSAPHYEPPPVTTTKKQTKVIAARRMEKTRRSSGNKKKPGLKESVMKGYSNRIPIPGGGSAVQIRETDAKVKGKADGKVAPKSKTSKDVSQKKLPSPAKKRSHPSTEGRLKEVNIFGSESSEDEDSEPGSKRAKEDGNDQVKKKGNTVATGTRFNSRNAQLTEAMIATPAGIMGKRRTSDPTNAKRAKGDPTAPNVRVVSTAAGEGDGANKGFAVRVCASPETVEDDLLPNIDMGKGDGEKTKKDKAHVTFGAKENEADKLKRKTLTPKQKKKIQDNETYKSKVIEFNSVNDIFFTMLYWNVNWPNERRKNASKLPAILGHQNEEAMTTISNYENVSDYCQIFSRLLLFETWESVYNAVVERTAQRITFNFAVFASRISFTEVSILECDVRVEKDECDGLVHPRKGHFVQLYLVLKKDSSQDNTKYTPRYGYITEARELQAHETNQISAVLVAKDKVSIFSPRWKIMRVSIMVRLREDNAKVDMNKVMKMDVITSIKGMVQYFEALFNIAQSPLLNDILNPQWQSYKLLEEENKEYRNFNVAQTAAIKKIVHACYKDATKICLVQGPPGTGKTKVVSHMVIDLLFGKFSQEFPHLRPKVLLCAPSNAAVDEDIRRVLKFTDALAKDKKKVNILRIGPETSISATVKHLSLYAKVAIEKQALIDRLKREVQAKNNEIKTCNMLLEAMQQEQKDSAEGLGLQMKIVHECSARDALNQQLEPAKSSRLRNEDFNKIQKELFCKADIIASTLDSIYCERLANLYKRGGKSVPPLVCIIDEAAQATEPATLIPLMYPVSKLILVGDHKQLPATVQSPIAAQYNLKQSLFERLNKCFAYTARTPSIMLTTQYRMHPEICHFPSRAFYEGKLETDGNIAKSYATCPFQPYVLFNVFNGTEQMGASKGEIYNSSEAKIVCELCKVLLRPDRSPLSVGVITFYRCQKQQIIRLMKERLGNCADKVEVNTVDGFQGREKDVIILSTVRAQGKMGFLDDRKRLNVALTRAKCCFYICGHVATLEAHELWADLIEDARDRRKIENISNDKDMEYLEQFVLKVS